MKKISINIIALLLTLNITPSFAHENHTISITKNNYAESPYIEKFCKDIVFTKKIKKNICKEISFTSSYSKEVNFCAKAVVNKKNVRKCKKFTLTPSNFTEVIDNSYNIDLPTFSNSPEIIAGKEHPAGYTLDLYSSNGEVVRWESCRDITYSIIGRDNEKRVVKELLPYIIDLFGYNLREVDGGRYQPFNENSNDLRIADIYFYFDYDEIDVKPFIENPTSSGVAVNSYIFDYSKNIWITKNSNIAVRMSITPEMGNLTKPVNDNSVITTLLHEIGHAFGLGHVDDIKQMMYYNSFQDLQKYQSGDLAGIEFLKNDKSKCNNLQ